MIVFDLNCDGGHCFEGWFGSSEDFSGQMARGLVTCPQCGSAKVEKAPMAPAVPKKGNQRGPELGDTKKTLTHGPLPAEVTEALGKLAEAQAQALASSRWVGDGFAEHSRAMHYGERDAEAIHGRASAEEARALIDEGVPVAPLPFPVAPPEELN